jgi:hypothetical protein
MHMLELDQRWTRVEFDELYPMHLSMDTWLLPVLSKSENRVKKEGWIANFVVILWPIRPTVRPNDETRHNGTVSRALLIDIDLKCISSIMPEIMPNLESTRNPQWMPVLSASNFRANERSRANDGGSVWLRHTLLMYSFVSGEENGREKWSISCFTLSYGWLCVVYDCQERKTLIELFRRTYW